MIRHPPRGSFTRRRQIDPRLAPRMTTAQPAHPEQRSPTSAMQANGLHGVMRTARGEPATSGRAKENSEKGRERPLIQANEASEKFLRPIHEIPFSSRASRRTRKKSRSTSRNGRPAMDGRATKTRSMLRARSCWCSRKLSRNKRRARLRTTALPIFLLVTTPRRVVWPAGRGTMLAMMQPQTRR